MRARSVVAVLLLVTALLCGVASGVLRSNAGALSPQGGTVTSVTAGAGLTGGGTSGALTVNVGAGAGVTVAADSIAVDTSTIQARVPTSCGASTFYTAIASNGTATCTAEVGDISSVTAGTSLTGGGTTGAVTLNVALPGATCSAGQAVTAVSAAGSGTCNSFLQASGTGLTTVSGTVSVNIAGASCSGGSSVTAIGATGTGTCTTPQPGDAAGVVIEWSDEFLTATPNTAFWTAQSSGGTVTSTTDTGGVRVGTQAYSTGAGTTGRQGIANANNTLLLGHGQWTVDWILMVPTLDDGTDKFSVEAGMFDTFTSADQTDGCFFAYDRSNTLTGGFNAGNANKLECVCAANSVRTGYLMDGTVVSDGSFTTVNAPVAAGAWPSTSVLNLELQVNSAGTQADFYVNGVKSCQITSNIPTAAARYTAVGINILKSAGTTPRTFELDRFHVRDTLASPRTP